MDSHGILDAIGTAMDVCMMSFLELVHEVVQHFQFRELPSTVVAGPLPADLSPFF